MTLTTPAKKDCLRESGAFAWVVVIALGLMSAGTTGTYSIIAAHSLLQYVKIWALITLLFLSISPRFFLALRLGFRF